MQRSDRRDPDSRSVGLDGPASHLRRPMPKQIDPSNTNVAIRVLSPGTRRLGVVQLEHGGFAGERRATFASTAWGNSDRSPVLVWVLIWAPTESDSQSQPYASCGCSVHPRRAASAAVGGDRTGSGWIVIRDPRSIRRTKRRTFGVPAPGNDGSVSQSNNAGSAAIAGNAALTAQNASHDRRLRPRHPDRPAGRFHRTVALAASAATGSSVRRTTHHRFAF